MDQIIPILMSDPYHESNITENALYWVLLKIYQNLEGVYHIKLHNLDGF